MNASSWFPQVSAPNPASGVQGIWNAYNQSQEASRAANADLAQQSLNWWGGIMDRNRADLNQAVGFLRGTNRANNRDIDKRFSALSGETAQGLIDRGLGNSTIQYSMQKGITNAHADALSRSRAEFGGRLYDAYARNAAANSGLAAQQLGFLSGINIGYPDMGAFASMAALAGAGGAGGAGGGGPSVVFDPSRPVGGALPAWAHYGGVGVDPGVADGGMYGNAPIYGGNTVYNNIPTTSQWAMQQRASNPVDTGGMWGPLYAAVQSAGQAGSALSAYSEV